MEDDVPASGTRVISPFRLVGVTLAITGLMLLGVQPWVKPQPGVLVQDASLVLVLNLIISLGLLGLAR